MISDKYKIASGMDNYLPALEIVEKTAAYCGLDKETTLQLRLMGEELLGMMQGLLLNYEGEFWLEFSDSTMQFHAEANSEITEAQRSKLISMASSGQNTKPKGFLNKLRILLESPFYCDPENLPFSFANECSFNLGTGQNGCFGYVWDMREALSDQIAKKRDEYDELEMSILGKVADNIVVSAYPPRISLTVSKTFNS